MVGNWGARCCRKRGLMKLIGFALALSVFLGVLAIGLRVIPGDLPSLLKTPSRLFRSLFAMSVLVPFVAVIICRMFALHPAVTVALVTLAISPVSNLFTLSVMPLLTPGHAAYARGLFFASTV